MVAVAVVCFGLYQEWQRHVIYDTQTAKEQAAAAHAKSCNDRIDAGGNLYGTEAFEQFKKDCPDFMWGSAKPATPALKNGKDQYDALSAEDLHSEFDDFDAKFADLTHTDGSEALKLCTYRGALRLISAHGYSREAAVRTAARDCR